MQLSFRRLANFLLLSAVFWVLLPLHPVAQAYDSTKILLPAVSDRSGYNSPELNSALLTKLRSQFRFPRYENILVGAMPKTPDRASLEKAVDEKTADGAAVVEISFLRNEMFYGFFTDETYEKNDLVLTLTYFDKKTAKYGQFQASRSSTQILSVYSGPLPLALEALEELLNRLDPIFPRQFPGPRY